jgi:hypothetical protein
MPRRLRSISAAKHEEKKKQKTSGRPREIAIPGGSGGESMRAALDRPF